jgi:hypothetical protein
MPALMFVSAIGIRDELLRESLYFLVGFADNRPRAPVLNRLSRVNHLLPKGWSRSSTLNRNACSHHSESTEIRFIRAMLANGE